MIRGFAITAALIVGCIADVAVAQTSTVPSQCAALEAEMGLLSAQISDQNDGVQAQAAEMIAAQSTYASAAKSQRRSGAVGDVIAGLIGSIIPGSEVVAGAANATIRDATPQAATPTSDAASKMTSALAEQGNVAVRIGALLEQRASIGCR